MFKMFLRFVPIVALIAGCGKGESTNPLGSPLDEDPACAKECEPLNESDVCDDLDETACAAEPACIVEYEDDGTFECEDLCDELDEAACIEEETCQLVCDDDGDDDDLDDDVDDNDDDDADDD